MERSAASLVARRVPLRPVPASVPQARRVLAELLAGTPLGGRADEARLAVSELVTNAVLHGRSPIELTLRLTQDCLHVQVRDSNPVSPSFGMLDPTAVTGRGLLLISASADRWGVEPHAHGKTVWFELDRKPSRRDRPDVEELLASWGDELVEDPAAEQVRVMLTDLDVILTARAEAHVEGLLRELALVLRAEPAGGPATGVDDRPAEPAEEQRAVAQRVLRAAAELAGLRAEMRRQLTAAVAADRQRIDLELTVTRGDAEAVRDFAHAVDDADRLSRQGRLLAAPAPPELSYARQSYLHRVLSQLAS